MTTKDTQNFISAEVDRLLAAKMLGLTTKDASGTPSNITAHGDGGLYSMPGLSPGIANAMLLPALGMLSSLPTRAANDMNPVHGIFTGVNATTGAESTDRCANPPTAGVSKLCQTTFLFGWIGRSSREMRIDKMGRITNRGEFTDNSVIGNPWGAPDVPAVPVPGGISQSMVTTEVGKVMYELAVALLRDQAVDIYTGNPTNNTGTQDDGGRTFYRGLDLLINTGYQDIITMQACPAADSIIEDYNNVNITTNPNLLVRTVNSIFRRLNHIAMQTGLAPVRFAIAMHPNLFYEVTELWPCAFMTNRCIDAALVGTQARITLDAEVQNNLKNDMRGDLYGRKGQFLWVDGEKIPVILDDAITETSPNIPGEFCSSMYIVPYTVRGGVGRGAPLSEGGNMVLYKEYFSFTQRGGAMDGARAMAPPGMFTTTANGRFLWMRDNPANLCVLFKGWEQPRLVLETPFLAARLTNVCYTPIAQVRSPFTDSAYFDNGGNTNFLGFGPSFWAPTS